MDGRVECAPRARASPDHPRHRPGLSAPSGAAAGGPPDDADVAASTAIAPILGSFARFATFVGAGRKLTQTGNLTLADARALVGLLGTGDIMDERIGDRIFATRSAVELPRLRQLFAWARKAGVVRVAHGRVIATKAGLAMAGNPAGFFDRAVDALLAIGPIASQRHPDSWLGWPQVDELLDSLVIHLLVGPYVAQRPIPIEDLASLATQAVLDAFEFSSLDDDHVARRVGNDVIDIIDLLELAGMVCRSGAREGPDGELSVSGHRLGGTVELTPAGVATTHRLLADAGYEAPIAGRFVDATATELLVGTDLEDFTVVWGEIQAWRRRLQPAEAARQLADAVRELADPALRNLALVLGDMEPAVGVGSFASWHSSRIAGRQPCVGWSITGSRTRGALRPRRPHLVRRRARPAAGGRRARGDVRHPGPGRQP